MTEGTNITSDMAFYDSSDPVRTMAETVIFPATAMRKRVQAIEGFLLAIETELKRAESVDPEIVCLRQSMRYLISAIRELAHVSRP
jgi:hypothetical protein